MLKRTVVGVVCVASFTFSTAAIYPSTAAVYTSSPIMKTAEGGFSKPSSASLQTLKSTEFTSVARLGVNTPGDGPRVVYTSTSAPCSMNSGAGDGGAQIKLADGNCAMANLAGMKPTPAIWGAKGDGTTDDTAAFQAAVNASAETTLYLDNHHYNITGPITINSRITIIGATNLWSQKNAQGCQPNINSSPAGPGATVGITNNATGINLFNINTDGVRIEGLCIQMAPYGSSPPVAGSVFNLFASSGQDLGQSFIEHNTIVRANIGVDISGTGQPGTSRIAGTVVRDNSFIDNRIAIRHGVNSAGGNATANTVIHNNSIFCGPSPGTRAIGIGVQLLDGGGIDYDGGTSGPEFCNIGLMATPGTVSGNGQLVAGQFTGVFGDQNLTHDILIQPTTALGSVTFFDSSNAWAAATSNVNSVLIDCTLGACYEVTFNGLTSHAGTGQAQPLMKVTGNIYDFSLVGSNLCSFGTPGASGDSALSLNPAGAGSGRFVITGNRFGTGCPGGSLHTGIVLSFSGGSSTNVTITGNDLSAVGTPLSYTPATADSVFLANNMGIDNNVGSVPDAATINPGINSPVFAITGTGTAVTTINPGGPANRHIEMLTLNGAITFNTGGNICNSLTSAGAGATVYGRWNATGCWFLK